LALAQRIRGHSLAVPLIVVSGDLQQFDRRHMENLQILEAFEKGFNLQQLARRIETLLRTKRTEPISFQG
jgi:DNA-binding response OmpR family regulator